MKKNILILLLSCILFSITACKRGAISGIKTENFSTGKAGELVLVINKNQWSETALEGISAVLTQSQPAINQIEPMFDLLTLSNSDFNAQFQKHRGIVRFELGSHFLQNRITVENNVWSSPQIYVHITGNDADSCLALFLNQQDDIIKILYNNDLKRVQSFYLNNNHLGAENLIKQKFGVTMTIPEQYEIYKEAPDFLWLLFRTVRNDRIIIVYKTQMNELTPGNIIAARNSVTKAHVPGAIEGAYPIVAEKMGLPVSQSCQISSKQGFEMRGLWESVGDMMGGPFYNFSFLDPTGENCISIDGFVYAPEEKKRDYLREVEAIVRSVK